MSTAQLGGNGGGETRNGVLFEDPRYFHWQVLHASLPKGS